MKKTEKLIFETMKFFEGDEKRIQHFIKVHSLAKLIAKGEELDKETIETVEAAAIVHDVGIKPAEEKFGKCDGKLQESEGPFPAWKLMNKVGFSTKVMDRACYLVAHHHSYENVDGIDLQILIEADFLVNAYEDGLSAQGIGAFRAKVFRTRSGIRLLDAVYGLA